MWRIHMVCGSEKRIVLVSAYTALGAMNAAERKFKGWLAVSATL